MTPEETAALDALIMARERIFTSSPTSYGPNYRKLAETADALIASRKPKDVDAFYGAFSHQGPYSICNPAQFTKGCQADTCSCRDRIKAGLKAVQEMSQ